MGAPVLLFDLDGTLTDPRLGLVRCLRYALEGLGRPCPADAVLASFIGPPLRRIFATLLDSADEALIAKALSLYREQYGNGGLFENRVYDGVAGMLEATGRMASASFVATSKLQVYAQRIVRRFGLDRHFAGVYGAELGRLEQKDELLAHLLAAEQIPVELAVMVGDRGVDVLAARAHGIRSIGVLWGYGSEPELLDAGVDRLCAAPGELASCLAQLGGWAAR